MNLRHSYRIFARYVFRNVDDLVEFPGVVKKKHLTYALKLMIAREIEQEKIRRLETTLTKSRPSNGRAEMDADRIPFNDVEMDSDAVSSETPSTLPHPAGL